MQLLINNENIVGAIDSSKSTCPDELIWRNIYPIFKVPKLIDGIPPIYITLDVYAPKVRDKTYKDVVVAFNIFAHDNIQMMSNGYSVVDYLQAEVEEIFNGKSGFGIGDLELWSNDLIKVGDDHFGTTSVYKVTNFNHIESLPDE